jgi:N-acylneuraminate cytidylyltransferase
MRSSNEVTGHIAVVPARGGSKRIPRKNVIDFHGKPMITWPLEMLLLTGRFEAVIVSTDDAEIAAIAAETGPVVVVKRPNELAGDDVPTAPVIVHAVEEYEKQHASVVSSVTVLYPTAVFTTQDHLVRADELLASSGARLVMSVGRYRSPIARAWSRTASGLMQRLDPLSHLATSQSLSEAFFDAGQFYVADRRAWEDWQSDPAMAVCGLVLPALQAIDIDNSEDLQFAQQVFIAMEKFDDESDLRGG